MAEPGTTLDRSYRGDAATLGTARRDVLAWLSGWGADEAAKERAALIVSELATNALQASPGGTYTVQAARVDDQHAAITVRNATSGTVPPSPDKWRPVNRAALRGRGLGIVKSLSQQVTVDSDSGEVVVTALIRLH